MQTRLVMVFCAFLMGECDGFDSCAIGVYFRIGAYEASLVYLVFKAFNLNEGCVPGPAGGEGIFNMGDGATGKVVQNHFQLIREEGAQGRSQGMVGVRNIGHLDKISKYGYFVNLMRMPVDIDF